MWQLTDERKPDESPEEGASTIARDDDVLPTDEILDACGITKEALGEKDK